MFPIQCHIWTADIEIASWIIREGRPQGVVPADIDRHGCLEVGCIGVWTVNQGAPDFGLTLGDYTHVITGHRHFQRVAGQIQVIRKHSALLRTCGHTR